MIIKHIYNIERVNLHQFPSLWHGHMGEMSSADLFSRHCKYETYLCECWDPKTLMFFSQHASVLWPCTFSHKMDIKCCISLYVEFTVLFWMNEESPSENIHIYSQSRLDSPVAHMQEPASTSLLLAWFRNWILNLSSLNLHKINLWLQISWPQHVYFHQPLFS